MPMIVALHGAMSSGKSTVAGYLCREHGFEAVHIASPLKAMTSALLLGVGLPHDLVDRTINGDLKSVPVGRLGGHSVRFVMQKLGAEYRDLLTPHLCRDIADHALEAGRDRGVDQVVDDLRFHNELDMFDGIQARKWFIRGNNRQISMTADAAAADILASGSLSTPGRAVYSRMVQILLEYCGIDSATAHRCVDGDLVNSPVAMMGGKSTRFALAALEAEFAMMVFGSRPMAEKTAAGHVSEAGLPIARFDLVIDNDATIQRLYGTVDAALAANDATGGRAAAA